MIENISILKEFPLKILVKEKIEKGIPREIEKNEIAVYFPKFAGKSFVKITEYNNKCLGNYINTFA